MTPADAGPGAGPHPGESGTLDDDDAPTGRGGGRPQPHGRVVRLGRDCAIASDAAVGVGDGDAPTVLGDRATVRSGTTIYCDVSIGDDLTTGHNVVVRSGSTVGDDAVLGTNVVLDGAVTVGDAASLQTGAYVPDGCTLGDRVFLGPSAVLTNDPSPVRADRELSGAVLGDDVSVGANATVLPGVRVGEGSFVAAGAVAVEDVPSSTLAVGVPADHRPLPPSLEGANELP